MCEHCASTDGARRAQNCALYTSVCFVVSVPLFAMCSRLFMLCVRMYAVCRSQMFVNMRCRIHSLYKKRRRKSAHINGKTDTPGTTKKAAPNTKTSRHPETQTGTKKGLESSLFPPFSSASLFAVSIHSEVLMPRVDDHRVQPRCQYSSYEDRPRD